MEIYECNASVATARYGSLLVAICSGPLSVRQIRTLQDATDRGRAEHGARVVSMTVMRRRGATLQAPKDEQRTFGELRASLTAAMVAAQRNLAASALVIDARGFKSAAIRSAFLGLHVAVRPKFPLKVFATPSDGAAWLVGHTSDARSAVTREVVMNVFAGLTRAHDAAGAT